MTLFAQTRRQMLASTTSMMAALSLGRSSACAATAGGSKEAVESIDQALRQAVHEKAVPGVVAMAAGVIPK